tara:strand:- start:157 stop:357 length:201 start_codon:yes stop_codon:yes gene_type:complete
MVNEKKASASRRDFLKTASLGVGVAALAGTALKNGKAEASTKSKGLEGAGYRETEHIKKYYELARM